jgi:hypothetical protein
MARRSSKAIEPQLTLHTFECDGKSRGLCQLGVTVSGNVVGAALARLVIAQLNFDGQRDPADTIAPFC